MNDKCQLLPTKHNDILEELLFEEGYLHIIDLQSLIDENYFDHQGNLLAAGRIQFWKEVDMILKEFDHNKIELLPRQPLHSAGSGNPYQMERSHSKPVLDKYHVDHRPNQYCPQNHQQCQSLQHSPAALHKNTDNRNFSFQNHNPGYAIKQYPRTYNNFY